MPLLGLENQGFKSNPYGEGASDGKHSLQRGFSGRVNSASEAEWDGSTAWCWVTGAGCRAAVCP